MPDTNWSGLVALKNALSQASALTWLVRAELDGGYGLLANNGDASITHNGETYAAFPFRVEGFESGERLPQPRLILPNVGPTVAERLDAGELIDRTVRLYLTWRGAGLAVDFGRWTATEAVLSLDAVTITLANYALLDQTVPALRQHRTRCSKVFGSADCGYDTTLAELVVGVSSTSCDLGYATDNGCVQHGANEAANGAAVRHPARFGGFPGIPKGPARL